MADQKPEYDQRKDEITNELVRNPISEPLYSEIRDAPSSLYDVMIEVNLQYRGGRDLAFQRVQDLTREALATLDITDPTDVPVSIGSTSNPYMSCRLRGDVIKEIMRLDAERARAECPPHAPQSEIRSRLAIYRVWEDFPVHPLIDRSIITVKADAARRAFLAEGRTIVWAVIDSGVDVTHQHFKETKSLELQLPLRHYDFTKGALGDNAPSALQDGFGHGTHVAGIIAGGVLTPCLSPCSQQPGPTSAPTPSPVAGAAAPAGPTVGALRAVRTRMDEHDAVVPDIESLDTIAGMAPYCKIVSLKVLDESGNGNVSRVIAALDFIQQVNDFGRQNLIHGVNLSLGYEFDPRWFACGQSPICAEVNRLVRSGVVVVVAAGNTGYGTVSSKARATGAGLPFTINDPGNAEFAITVGSTHRDMPHTYGVSYFSSKGPTGDGRMKPDLLAPGERILSCQSSSKNPTGDTKTYVEDTGTSMSAPHVSGVIASFLSIRKEYIGKPDEVKQIFMNSATDLKRERALQGSGLVDLMRAIQSV